MKFESLKESAVSRIAGTEKIEETQILEAFKEIYEMTDAIFREIKKSPEIEGWIEKINIRLMDFVKRHGADPIHISPQKVLLVDETKLPPGFRGGYLPEHQVVVIPVGASSQALSDVFVHEMMHFNSFQSYTAKDYYKPETNEKTGITLHPRRIGIRMPRKEGDEERELFYDFDEATIEELTARFIQELYPQHSALQEIGARATRAHDLEIKEVDGEKVVITKEVTPVFSEGSYVAERMKLNQLIDELYQKNRLDFASREDVFSLFARAVLTGRLLPLARLIEKTFGRGSFRQFAESTAKKTVKVNMERKAA